MKQTLGWTCGVSNKDKPFTQAWTVEQNQRKQGETPFTKT